METSERGDRGGEGEGLNPTLNSMKIHDYEYLKMAFKTYTKSLKDLKALQPVNYLFISHLITGGIVPLSVTFIGGISIYPYMGAISMINLLLGIYLNGRTVITSRRRLIWVFVFFLGPHILGQPVNNLEAFTKSANLAFYNFSVIGAYEKNDAISTLTSLLSLAASLSLVLDWMRWWQEYPLPIINAIAFGHVITATYICL